MLMIGTNFSDVDAILLIPPRTTSAVRITTISDTIQGATWKAPEHASLIELQSVIDPMNPSAIVQLAAKNPARNFPNLFGNAFLM